MTYKNGTVMTGGWFTSVCPTLYKWDHLFGFPFLNGINGINHDKSLIINGLMFPIPQGLGILSQFRPRHIYLAEF